MSVLPNHDSRAVSVAILAGGLSARMGRDKARLRLQRSTLLAHARRAADPLGVPIRIVRRDLVPRCGPLGGIFTALRTSHADTELFLACDMPFVSATLLRRLLRAAKGRRAAFTVVDGVAGFPFAMKAGCLPVVERQLAAKELSLQSLARALRAARVLPPRSRSTETYNVNTPDDLAAARARNSQRKTVRGLKRTARL